MRTTLKFKIMEDKKVISEEKLLRFTGNLILIIGTICFVAELYQNVIEEFEISGLFNSALILCGTLFMYSILLVLAKISEKLEKK